MKQFTIIKVGYSKGQYGINAEYFTLIYQDGIDIRTMRVYGLYGTEQRIKEFLTGYGYKFYFVNSDYGEMQSRTSMPFHKSEEEAMRILKDELSKTAKRSL